jgi:hypothetical protein
MYVKRNIVTRLRTHCCYRKATMLSFCVAVELHVAVNNIKRLKPAAEIQEWFPLHCCRNTKYIVLLSTV